jgi:diphthamide synthase (EF-2-diphthine--ammonia ligase)
MYTRRRAKWEERVNKLRELISDAEEEDAEAIADGTYNEEISRQYMDELQSELSLLLSVAR